MLRQPDDLTCGPTCLHAVYRFFGDELDLDGLIREVPALEEGGTLAVFLGCHALRRGYQARIYTFNLSVFDPTWFGPVRADLRAKLTEQMRYKPIPKLHVATRGYLDFLNLGGELDFTDLTVELIRSQLMMGRPILTGLSATYLYRGPREYGRSCTPSDVRGFPVGHFVVLCGFDEERRVLVADPMHPNPLAEGHVYSVNIERVLGAILLGVLTHDANMLILWPRGQSSSAGAPDVRGVGGQWDGAPGEGEPP